MQISFLGATETVTGSKYLILHEDKKILVDCGLYQGYKKLRLKNWLPLPIDPKAIDFVVLTHAHIDHTGYLPLLVKNGFTGPIYATEGTYDLCSILLPDSGHIQEEDARRANKYGYTKHKPALPLYTSQEAKNALLQFKKIEYDKSYPLLNNGNITWRRAGHILGSAFIEFSIRNIKTLFSGDMGRQSDPVMRPPEKIKSLDYLILESTYGNRLHEKEHPKEILANIINKTAARGGTVVIPSFAVGRSQSILHYLAELKKEDKIPNLPIYLDSPMAINASDLLCKHSNEHTLTKEQCHDACNIAKYTRTPDESKEIDQNIVPKIIISASGMATGGRVLHHLNAFASDKRSTILFTGYQAGGTRGARMIQGEKEIKLFGHSIPVRAEVCYLTNTSAHSDYSEMLEWLGHFDKLPKRIYLTHGEKNAASHLKESIEKKFQVKCIIPAYHDKADLS